MTTTSVSPRSAGRSARDAPTLAIAYADRRNALGTIRLALAVAVVVSHAFLTTGTASGFTQLIGFWSVNGFFALSGYLIADSRARLPARTFAWHRVLRIVPAYWVALVGVALIAAPLSTVLTGEHWDALSALGYVGRNAGLVIAQPGVDDTLRAVPHGLEWNAPLWTLAHEAIAYVVAGLVLSIGAVRRQPLPWMMAAVAAYMIGNVVAYGPLAGWVPLAVLHALRLGGFFAAGMLLWALRDRLPLRWWLAAACVAGLFALQLVGMTGWLGTPLFAYLVLWLGARLPLRLGPTDLSYGLYVYTFPVQQLLAAAGIAALGPLAASAVALPLGLGLAWHSWRFVERPALSLKGRWLGRRQVASV